MARLAIPARHPPRVAVIIPALDEEDALPYVLRAFPPGLARNFSWAGSVNPMEYGTRGTFLISWKGVMSASSCLLLSVLPSEMAAVGAIDSPGEKIPGKKENKKQR